MSYYADACSIMAMGNNIDDLCNLVNGYLKEIYRFFTACNLQIPPTKTSAKLFATSIKEVKLNIAVVVGGVQMPTVNHPKMLGVTFDSLYSFSAHATAITHIL